MPWGQCSFDEEHEEYITTGSYGDMALPSSDLSNVIRLDPQGTIQSPEFI